MTSLLTPGLYFQQVQPVRAAGPLARGDVPVFLGYTRRGPAGAPVRVESTRQFSDLFGEPATPGHLSGAVHAFFGTGGAACYVMRVVDDTAAAAAATLVDPENPESETQWVAEASFPWPRIDPKTLSGSNRPGAQAWAAAFEAQVREHGRRTPDVGVWGDGLSAIVSRRSLVSAETEPGRLEDGFASRIGSLAGLEPHSLLVLHQDVLDEDGVTHHLEAPAEVNSTDAVRQILRWKVAPETLPADQPEDLSFDPEKSIRVTSVEFRVDVFVDGRLAERFDYLSPHPEHSRSLDRVLREECRNLHIAPGWNADEATDWSKSSTWPAEITVNLAGGRDGVAGVDAEDYRAQLEATARVDEIALVAAPDLVLETTPPPETATTPSITELDCADPQPAAKGILLGRVRAAGLDDEQAPALRGVRVEVAGTGAVADTDSAGLFRIEGVPRGLRTLRLSKDGFEPAEAIAQALEFEPSEPVAFSLAALVAPRRLHDDEILTVQNAMMNPDVVGPYRVAVLDPPRSSMKLDDLRNWRAKLGDSQRGAFFGPWLKTPGLTEISESALLPPSGHVCGALARAEQATGVHRAPANLPLRHVDGVTLEIGEAEQGLLNPIGINAIRAFPGRGVRIYGARTLSSDPQWRYVTTRRLVDAVEKTLERALQWAVFEPHSLFTRQAVAFTITSLLDRLWRRGALAGERADAAYAVKSDFDNNPQADRDAGRLIAEVALAPSIPFEFVLFRLGRTLETIEVTE